MKKCFYMIVLITISISIYAVPYVSPVRYMEILPCNEVMNMDGNDVEGSWGQAIDFTLFNSAGWSGVADFSGYFRLCWDEDYLYFFADITDDYNHSFDISYADEWMFDNIEIYFDLDTINFNSTGYDDRTIQLRFNRGLDYALQSGRADAADFLYHYKEHAAGDGWIVEAGIPWTCVMPAGSLPEDIHDYVDNVMGFDVNFADSDNSDGNYAVGNRDAQASWDLDGGNGTEDLAWNNTSVFGIVELLTETYPPAIPYTDPVRTFSVPARTGAIIFDGLADEDSWGSTQDVSLFSTWGYSGSSDFDAEFRLCWDMEYLYFFAEISDDVNHSYQQGLADVWMFDNIELFIDLDTVMGSTEYDENTVQLRFSRGLNQVETTGRAGAPDFLYYWENTAGGWVVETGIPWSCVLPEGWLPDDIQYFINNRMGFDVNFADSDNSDGDPAVGNRDAQSAWDADGLDGTEDMAWNNTHVFGIIDLIGEPSGTNPEPAGLPYRQPLRDMDIPIKFGTFTADANDAEAFWSYPQQLTVFNDTDYFGDADMKTRFRTAWDPEYLYLYAELYDDVEQSWSSGLSNPEYYDNLEVYLDLDTFCRESDYRTNSTAMIRFCRGSNEVQATGRAAASDFLYSLADLPDGAGWRLEAAIPWTCALATGASISDMEDYLPVIGFDVTVNDLDAGTPPGRELITQAAWDLDDAEAGQLPAEDQAMVNTRMFGIAILSPYELSPLEESQISELRIFPNPASGMLKISADRPIFRIQLVSLIGQVVQEIQADSDEITLDIASLPAGTYLVKCQFRDGSFMTEIVIHQ
ncbi:MAG: T9SS type A sorting domain-containing protein [Bacteroidales bacterium]|nr:T9SS type A sorting domain-containing protein [Bacteroidales bacterium]